MDRRQALQKMQQDQAGGALLLAQLLANNGANLNASYDPRLQQIRAAQLSEMLKLRGQ